MRISIFWSLGTFLFWGHAAQAQLPALDITSSLQAGSELHVSIRPDGPFDGLFSSVVFTVRCDQASAPIIGEPLQGLPQVQYCSVFRSDVQQDQGAYTYQIFAGFGNSALLNFGAAWVADQEVLFCRIPITNSNGSCILVNDAWTDANNGGYYVSLNGEDRTGVIYGTSTAVDQAEQGEQGFSLLPNPASDQTRLLLRTEAAVSHATMIMLDAAGKRIWSEGVLLNGGVLAMDLDLQGLAAGLYTVQVNIEGQQLSQRLVVQ